MLHPGLLPAVPGRAEAVAAAVGARAQLVLHQSLVLLVSSIATARYEIFVSVSVGVGVTMLAVAVPHEERGALQSVQGCPVGADGHARCGMGQTPHQYEYYYWQQRWPLTELRQVESRPYASRPRVP